MERFTHDTYPLSDREKKGAAIARKAAGESMVLLKNEGFILPIRDNETIALYGTGAVRTVRGGTGSGDPFNGGLSGGGLATVNQSTRYHINVFDSFKNNGMTVVNGDMLKGIGERYDERATRPVKGFSMGPAPYPEEELKEEQAMEDAAKTDTAIFVLGRNSGEGMDRQLTSHNEDGEEIGDYNMSAVEKANIALIRRNFKKFIVVLNVGSQVNMTEILDVKPDAILLMGQAGQEGGDALFDVITGKVNPSGKLAGTWAKQYSDYPASATFANNDGNPMEERYEEGIYVGYRYFDSFGVEPVYEFGYGLSYTDFDITFDKVQIADEKAIISVHVINTGRVSGKEVVQVYVSAPADANGGLDTPKAELKGFKKTKLLAKCESELLTIEVPLRSIASFDDKKLAYRIFAGEYAFAVGNSSKNVKPAFKLRFNSDIETETVYEELPLKVEMECIKAEKKPLGAEWDGVPVVNFEGTLKTIDSRSKYQGQEITTYTTDPEYKAVRPYESVELVKKEKITMQDVMAGKKTAHELLAQFTMEELVAFVCGTGWGVADDANPIIGASSESVPGAAGETVHILEEKYGIPSIVLADGPGGVRITQIFDAKDEAGEPVVGYHFCIAWPVGSLLAQSFDTDLWYEVGCGMAEDVKAFKISLLLGPGINIQRDPLGGRNFEYFSEDPLLTGKCSAYLTKGIQCYPETGACIKHYACNSQETMRHASDSQVPQRALREIYLKPFEITVKEASPKSIMTGYNKINSVPCGDSYDLCTNLARGEWGFDGLIMTDWNGGMSEPYISMHAGNDLIMPGGPNKIENIMLALKTIMPQFDDRGQVFMEIQSPFPIANAKWNSFSVSADGADTVEAEIKGEHKCEVKDGVLYVDDEVLYTETGTIHEAFRDRENFKQFKTPATTEVASFSDDFKKVIYKGTLERTRRTCIGDVERCAENVLRGIIRLQP